MAELDYETLRKIQAKERASAALSELPAGFYALVRQLVLSRKEKLNSGFTVADAKEFENLMKVVREIYDMREQKILLKALGKAAENRNDANMQPEEKQVFGDVGAVVDARRAWFEGILEGRNPELDSVERRDEKIMHVKLLMPIPRYAGRDRSYYGPFDAGVIASLPKDEAELLVKKGAAERA